MHGPPPHDFIYLLQQLRLWTLDEDAYFMISELTVFDTQALSETTDLMNMQRPLPICAVPSVVQSAAQARSMICCSLLRCSVCVTCLVSSRLG